jgi:hypothetical protein
MDFDSMISFSEFSYKEELKFFSEDYQKRHPDRIKLIEDNKDKIAVFSGSGFEVLWTEPHDCGCEYCYHEQQGSKFFENKEDAEKYVRKIEKYDEFDDIELIDGIFFVKAVKQNVDLKGTMFE